MMKKHCFPIFLVATLISCGGPGYQTPLPGTPTTAIQTGVQVSSPANNSTVSPTVNYSATATTSCANGVADVGIYSAPGVLAYKVQGGKLNANLTLNPGKYNTTVQEWDNCGGSASTPVNITVSSGSAGSGSGVVSSAANANAISNLQNSGGWTGYALLPPSYGICSSCTANGPQTTWSTSQGVSSPSLSGSSMQFNLGGSTQFSDALWNNHLVGQFSSQGIPDSDSRINSNAHNFVYDVYFFADNIGAAQALEFDINQFVNGQSFIWGHECRIAGGNQWDIWDNQGQKWHPTGVACNPSNNQWNHLTIEVARTSDGHLLFQSITLNGQTATLNYYESPTPSPWSGITANYQQDGNAKQQPYSIWLDNFSFNFW